MPTNMIRHAPKKMTLMQTLPTHRPAAGSGRAFSLVDIEQARAVCLINPRTQERLALDSDPTGQSILINKRRFIVVGVVEKSDNPYFTGGDTRAEVWMSLIHGSMGLVYFVHQFKPFNEHALLDDPAMLTEVTRVNKQIQSLAPVLNSPSAAKPATVVSANQEVPIASMTKTDGSTVHIFTVAMRPGETKAIVTVPGQTMGKVTVLGEDRTISMQAGRFEDVFRDWDVHLYEIRP